MCMAAADSLQQHFRHSLLHWHGRDLITEIPIGAAGGQVPFLPAAAAQTSMNSAGNDYVSWFIPGPNGVNGEPFYVDEVAFVK